MMNALGITQKIFDFASCVVGSIKGGLAQVNVLASMIFAGISGAALADAAGLGTIEIKAMKRAGYDEAFSAAVTVCSATIGPIIPPSIMMVIYAIMANVSIAEMFLAGVTLPALLISVPTLMPVMAQFGIDPVHFGVIVIFNLLIGIITPPMGIGLYVMVAVSGVRFEALVKACMPFLLALLASLAAITYLPELSLFLPELIRR